MENELNPPPLNVFRIVRKLFPSNIALTPLVSIKGTYTKNIKNGYKKVLRM